MGDMDMTIKEQQRFEFINNGLYEVGNGELLGEYGDNRFVPSRALLEKRPSYQKKADAFVKAHKGR